MNNQSSNRGNHSMKRSYNQRNQLNQSQGYKNQSYQWGNQYGTDSSNIDFSSVDRSDDRYQKANEYTIQPNAIHKNPSQLSLKHEAISNSMIQKSSLNRFRSAPVIKRPQDQQQQESSSSSNRQTPSTASFRKEDYKQGKFNENDYSNHYIHSNDLPINHVRNIKNPVEGYPKLQRLFQLKEKQVDSHACTPYGARVGTEDIVSTLNSWIVRDKLVFDVIMIGALTENQFIYPLLTQLPLERLCSRPGFLFIWASAQKINELSKLLNTGAWAKKFRRSEELVFVPVSRDSPYYPNADSADDESLFERMQWHCWMCITGTIRRSTDGHLIHCNVDTDLQIEDKESSKNRNSIVPDHIYKVAENFSSATRRLHIIPARSGFNNPVRPRRGWVIMSPDIIIDNFEAQRYKDEIASIGSNIPQDQEIENMRPKSPVPRSHNSNNNNNNNNHHRSNNTEKYVNYKQIATA